MVGRGENFSQILERGTLFMAFFEDAIEILRRMVVAVGTERFIDSFSKNCERIDPVDYKAKGQKINNYKIRPPNSFSLSNMVRLLKA